MTNAHYERWKITQARIERLLYRMEAVLREMDRIPALSKRNGVEALDAPKES